MLERPSMSSIELKAETRSNLSKSFKMASSSIVLSELKQHRLRKRFPDHSKFAWNGVGDHGRL